MQQSVVPQSQGPQWRTTRYTFDNLDRLTDEKWYDGAAPTAIVATTTQGGPHGEVQRVSHTGSVYAGTFTLTFDGQTTASIAYNASSDTVGTARTRQSLALRVVPGGPWDREVSATPDLAASG